MTLFRDSISDHLTSAPADQMARQTHPGMAHFAGTGPVGKSCRECSLWQHTQHDYDAGGWIKPAPCLKVRKLTNKAGAKIPGEAAACRYFDENPTPPSRMKPPS